MMQGLVEEYRAKRIIIHFCTGQYCSDPHSTAAVLTKKLTVARYMEILPFLLENTDCDHIGKCISEQAVFTASPF